MVGRRGALRVAALALLAAGCQGPAVEREAPAPITPEPPPPEASEEPALPVLDHLTDLGDDGSLVAGLHDPDPLVRQVAARGLGRLRAPRALEALANRVTREAHDAVLAELLFALGQVGDARGGELLAAQLRGGSAVVRAAAAEALGRLGDAGRTTALVVALDDAEDEVRGRAALALARLGGRRWDEVGSLSEALADARARALARAAIEDPAPGVRWRAAYALAEIDADPPPAAVLTECLVDGEPLCRVFGLRGLAAHWEPTAPEARPLTARLEDLLADQDRRVAVEAAVLLGRVAEPELLARYLGPQAHPRPRVRAELVRALERRADELDDAIASTLRQRATVDDSSAVRRAAWRALAALPDGSGAAQHLASSDDARNRLAAAEVVARDGDEELLRLLAEDDVPGVAAAALEGLGVPRFTDDVEVLIQALGDEDVARVTGAAHAAGKLIEAGRAPPDLVQAVAEALPRHGSFETVESRQALRAALGLQPAGVPLPTGPAPRGRLLDRLVDEYRAALADPSPRVRLSTGRGDVLLQLDRPAAPRHVASFLERAEAGAYNGLSFHRVVSNFVTQGLDPRGDGWGTGGVRLPDEVNPLRYETGTLGTPNAGEPHTDGCQIFLTHLPTPHLDGRYTVFGRVLEGMDVVLALEVGDVVRRVERVSP